MYVWDGAGILFFRCFLGGFGLIGEVEVEVDGLDMSEGNVANYYLQRYLVTLMESEVGDG